MFAGACLGCLFLMKDFGTALIFFATFLIIAFMRSGSFRTIFLILAAACFGVFLIVQFLPHVTQRFAGWLHVWESPNDLGYQQTRTLTYIASGGLFGTGIGNGYLKYMPASDSDLVFGMLCEEQGLFMGLVVLAGIAMFILYARSDVTRSRSIVLRDRRLRHGRHAALQTCLNVFGPTDVLPFTGVTLPFISSGGSSILSTWGLMAFLKASDERTYAAKRGGRRRPGVENSCGRCRARKRLCGAAARRTTRRDIPVRTRGAAAGRSAQPQHRADGTSRLPPHGGAYPPRKSSRPARAGYARKEDDRR